MKAYKATYNFKCIDLIYEIGKTYTFQGELSMCERGFHFCKKIDDIFQWYNNTKELVLLEIEVLGQIIDHPDNDKSVTDKIKIIREIPRTEWNSIFEKYKFDEKGNMIYEKDSYGGEYFWKYKYDEKGNMIYKKYSDGKKIFWEYKYDEKENKIYEKGYIGVEYFWEYKYDEEGNVIYKKDCNGREYFYKYDEKGNKIYEKNSDGKVYSILIEEN